MKKYVLPDLAYGYSALEPHYSARPLELHHRKHHAAYVKGVVQLSGFVRSQADIDQAVQVARGVAGVKSVKNAMRIK